ncbi:MAG: Na+/H+ antiporter subunit E [Planctomycetales bacterium]|nr:Na+/H+ antiporter subunit E [Planctomycetales bacterium]NIM08869.1 Na+/H+ antiporter subunit E [Planctomycetales bacterium]NIN08329.1 Na+/H+ antiporter subunit E [Planctomycetales bacterium]NIN77457.1 Na+/H+ antiporter subunit E [Planctomycetales bacterium]NIO34629.1 Na+/H+ antiporter subunit E [Planctomycetales bacterium]
MNRLILFVLLFLFWVVLTWTAVPPGPAYLQDVGAGLAAALLVTWAVGEKSGTRLAPWLQPQRYAWAIVYFFVLAVYVIKANLDVAYRVLHPAMPIRPGIVRVKTRLRQPAARAALGNSITLCPGTLAVDIHEDGTMMVHWIYVRSLDEAEAGRMIISRFEWFLEKILE